MRIGDKIILGIDMDTIMHTGNLARRLQILGLYDIALSTHSLAFSPAIFNRNENQFPVNTIYATWNLIVTQEGDSTFDASKPSVLSDGHKLIWIESNTYSILGKHVS